MSKKTKRQSIKRRNPEADAYIRRVVQEGIKVSKYTRASVAKLQKAVPRALYHYTNPEGVLGILRTNKFWATDIRFMNDATELSYSIGLLQELVEEKTRKKDKHFIFFGRIMADVIETLLSAFRIYAISFSESPDDLIQWKSYGGGMGGYSIGFDFKDMNFHRTISGASVDDDMLLVKAIYNRDLQIKLFKVIIERVCDGAARLYQELENGVFGAQSEFLEYSLVTDFSTNIVVPIVDWLLRFKHPKFAAEREWRLIRYIIGPDFTSGGGLTYPRHYRVRRGGIYPYVELRLPGSDKLTKLPIAEVWQGPATEPDLFKSLISECLVAFGYESHEIPIKQSQVPMRF